MRYKYSLNNLQRLEPDVIIQELHQFLLKKTPNLTELEKEELSDYVFEDCDWKTTAKMQQTIPNDIIIIYIREDWARQIEKQVEMFFKTHYNFAKEEY